MSYSFTQLQDDSSSWANAVRQREAVSNLMGTHFVVRKGLPYSFELEGQLGYLVNSELWTMGGSVKWSFHEAMRIIPIDFMVRGSVNHLVGSSQLDLTMAGVDLALGTQFGVLDLFNLSPYISYSPVWIYSGSYTLDSTPGVYDVTGINGSNSSAFVFPRQDEMVNRFAVGIRWLAGLIKLNPEFVWTPHQYTINLSLGLHLYSSTWSLHLTPHYSRLNQHSDSVCWGIYPMSELLLTLLPSYQPQH